MQYVQCHAVLKIIVDFRGFPAFLDQPSQCLPNVSFAKIHHAVKRSPQWAKHWRPVGQAPRRGKDSEKLGMVLEFKVPWIPMAFYSNLIELHGETRAIEIYTPLLWGDRVWRCSNELWWRHAPQPSEPLCVFAFDKHVSESFFLNNGWMVLSHLMTYSHKHDVRGVVSCCI